MNRLFLSLVAMALTSPVAAQSIDPGPGWAGGYLGVQLGFPLDASFTLRSAPGAEAALEGTVGGGHIGIRRQTSSFVYGGEIEFLVAEQAIAQAGFADTDVRVTTTRLGAQAGYDLGRFLPYGTVGVGRMTFQDTEGFGDTSSLGAFVGLGLEYQLGAATTVGLEAIHENYQNFNEGSDAEVSQTNLSVQFNIHF